VSIPGISPVPKENGVIVEFVKRFVIFEWDEVVIIHSTPRLVALFKAFESLT
jgi:hypothetical protein